MRSIIAEARRLDAEARLESNRYRKLLAKQGDALLERVALAREIYAGLKQTADVELNRRGKAGR